MHCESDDSNYEDRNIIPAHSPLSGALQVHEPIDKQFRMLCRVNIPLVLSASGCSALAVSLESKLSDLQFRTSAVCSRKAFKCVPDYEKGPCSDLVSSVPLASTCSHLASINDVANAVSIVSFSFQKRQMQEAGFSCTAQGEP